MTERWYLRINSAAGPLYYAGTYLATGEDDSRWSSLRASGVAYESPAEAHADRDVLLGNSPAVRVVRVGPPRRYTPTEKGRQATDTPPDDEQAAEKAPTRETGRETPAQGEGVGAADPGGWRMGDVWMSPTGHEHEVVDMGASWATLRIPERARESSACFVNPAANGWKLVSRAGKPWPPVAEPAPKPEHVPVTGLWCADSPVHEHAWQWREGGLVCAHCGGRRVGP